MREIFILKACLLLFTLTSSTVGAMEMPFKNHPDFKQYYSKYEPYYPLVWPTSNTDISGNYWEAKLKKPEKADKKKFYQTLETLNNMTLVKNGGQARFYEVKSNSTYFVRIGFYDKWYQIKMVKKAPYNKILWLNSDNELAYTSPKLTKLPPNKFLPYIDGYQIDRSKYRKFDKLKIRYKDGNRKIHNTAPEGQYWEAHYKLGIRDNHNNRYLLIHNLKDEIEKQGGKVLSLTGSSLVMQYKDSGNTIWGLADTYQDSMNIKLLKKDTFVQSLEINPDELKAELDKTGRVTLRGIFFDTNKATLKNESRPAIDAAATLMRKYPDLVIMVKGHTDNIGSPKNNMILSRNRAAAVKAALEKTGISDTRLQSKGFGESSPTASNDTPDGRAENRRVELFKISGGDKQAIIDIDFIKPMPGATETNRNEYQNRKFKVRLKDQSVFEMSGPSVKVWYQFRNDDNSVNTAVSRLETIKNYSHALTLLGASILQEDNNTLSFRLDDRGDGKKLYGQIEAYGQTYNIHLFVEE